MKNFKSYQLALTFYKRSSRLNLPKFLQDQLLRAASSIALNLAEGYGRRTPSDQRRFYDIAFGSIRECQSILDLQDNLDKDLLNLIDHLAASAYKLSRRVT